MCFVPVESQHTSSGEEGMSSERASDWPDDAHFVSAGTLAQASCPQSKLCAGGWARNFLRGAQTHLKGAKCRGLQFQCQPAGGEMRLSSALSSGNPPRDTTPASEAVCFLSAPQALPWGESRVPRMVSVANQTLSSKHSPPPCRQMCCPVEADFKASRMASECLSPAA